MLQGGLIALFARAGTTLPIWWLVMRLGLLAWMAHIMGVILSFAEEICCGGAGKAGPAPSRIRC